jgi:acetyltransferase-like isoleucine patch superfamily enzyme
MASLYQLSKTRFVFKSGIIMGKGFSIKSDISNTTIVINRAVRFRDNCHIMMGNNGSLIIGSNCFFNNNCSITCLMKIEIGHDTQFGENVCLYDHNHHYRDNNELISSQGYSTASISIGNNCWIGSNVVILKGVTIGNNVVIGAGCIIYKSVEAGTVVVNQQNLLTKKINE